VEKVTVLFPDGTSVDLETGTSSIFFTETHQVGVYTLLVNDRPWGKFAVNLLDADESDISPRGLPMDVEGVEDADTAYMGQDELQAVNQELWGYSAIFALLLLVVEWGFYHRNV
jgi:hypothetical protein